MATPSTDPKNLPRIVEGDWTVPKLIGLIFFVLATAFTLIYYASP